MTCAMFYGDSFLADAVGAARCSLRDAHVTVFRHEGAYDRSNARLEGDSAVYEKTTANPAAADMDEIDTGGSK